MRHYPATRHTAKIAGLEHARAPMRCPFATALLALATAFAAGVCFAAWFVALVIQGAV